MFCFGLFGNLVTFCEHCSSERYIVACPYTIKKYITVTIFNNWYRYCQQNKYFVVKNVAKMWETEDARKGRWQVAELRGSHPTERHNKSMCREKECFMFSICVRAVKCTKGNTELGNTEFVEVLSGVSSVPVADEGSSPFSVDEEFENGNDGNFCSKPPFHNK